MSEYKVKIKSSDELVSITAYDCLYEEGVLTFYRLSGKTTALFGREIPTKEIYFQFFGPEYYIDEGDAND